MVNENNVIRFAKYDDIPQIMLFIKTYWSSNHILANNRNFFEYQYVNNKEVHFVLAENNQNEIYGVLGFIPYDSDECKERDIFLALWKVRQGEHFLAGIDMLHYLEREGRCRNTYCVRINRQTFAIYKYMKKNIAKLEHYYMLNTSCRNYRIAEIKKKSETMCQEVSYEVNNITSVEQLDIHEINNEEFEGPYKSINYIRKRYFEHPIYVYRIFEIRTAEGIAYVVGREQECNGARVFRIVELWGKECNITNIGTFLKRIMIENEYEYIDCYEYGMSDACLEKCGLVKLLENDENIIPNYFEPFEKKNIDIYIFTPKGMKTRMFKGDGDQDRPSFW